MLYDLALIVVRYSSIASYMYKRGLRGNMREQNYCSKSGVIVLRPPHLLQPRPGLVPTACDQGCVRVQTADVEGSVGGPGRESQVIVHGSKPAARENVNPCLTRLKAHLFQTYSQQSNSRQVILYQSCYFQLDCLWHWFVLCVAVSTAALRRTEERMSS